MECFRHESRPAVGVCRSCLKGLCRACAAELERGLACAGSCEQDVRDLVATIDQSVRYRALSGGMLRTTRVLWLGLSVTALFVGVFVVAFGLSLPEFQSIGVLGLPFLAIGALLLLAARRAGSARA